jgi:uncharacterized protein (DUF302 family)
MAASHELSVSAVVLSIAVAAASAEDPQPSGTASTTPQPPVTTGVPLTPNTMMRPITREARDRLMRDTLAQSPLLLRDLINLMAHKVEAQPGLSFDEVVDSMKNRANKLNLKFVGANPLSKEVAAVTGKPTPRVEIFSFCDALLAREMLDYSLEFVIFMPCRIAVLEDAQQKIWLVMMDWNPDWLESTHKPIPDTLRDSARRLRQTVEDIIQAGASGAL